MASVCPSPLASAAHERRDILGLPLLVSGACRPPLPRLLYPGEPPVDCPPARPRPDATSPRTDRERRPSSQLCSSSSVSVHSAPGGAGSTVQGAWSMQNSVTVHQAAEKSVPVTETSLCGLQHALDGPTRNTTTPTTESHDQPCACVTTTTESHDQLCACVTSTTGSHGHPFTCVTVTTGSHDQPCVCATSTTESHDHPRFCVTLSSAHTPDESTPPVGSEGKPSTTSPASTAVAHSVSHSQSCGVSADGGVRLTHSRSMFVTNTTKPVSGIPARGPAVRREIVCDFEKELTFQPKMNNRSLRIVSRKCSTGVPVVNRLLQARKNSSNKHIDQLTFAPKLNATSLKLAQERAARMAEVIKNVYRFKRGRAIWKSLYCKLESFRW